MGENGEEKEQGEGEGEGEGEEEEEEEDVNEMTWSREWASQLEIYLQKTGRLILLILTETSSGESD